MSLLTTRNKVEAVAIGASAGGLEALAKILPLLHKVYPVPIFIVLHIPAGQPSYLSRYFETEGSLIVKEAQDKEKIKAGTVYFAPPGYHLFIEKTKVFSLTKEDPVNFSRPSIDVLFESAADTYGQNIAGILLSGSNEDGALGLKKIKDAGGLTIVQDSIEAEFKTMPRAGLSYVLPECVLSLDQISIFLQQLSLETISQEKNMNNDRLEILLVDDVKENIFALKALLARDDVNIFDACSGSEALELMMKHDFCLAMLDVQMPNMNGFELAEFMRGTLRTKKIPIIFVTAATKEEQYIFKGYESGAVDFLRKPLDPYIVKSKVNVFLELHRHKNELKEQIEELRETKEELQRAIAMREEFMAIAGHELKTPLTSLSLQAQLRLRCLKNKDYSFFSPEKLEEMFFADYKQVVKLTRLIDDMLDISRISSGQFSMQVENFDLCALAHDVIERNFEQYQSSGIKIKVTSSSQTINGTWDQFRIEQVITNLLTNAIRYGAGKPIEVRLSTDSHHAVIVIEDKGVGIEEKDLKRIFQKFERVTSSETNGIGIGLYIISQIIEAHNGTIKVESRPNEGSTFTIELPLSQKD